jgi:hypothetical protein
MDLIALLTSGIVAFTGLTAPQIDAHLGIIKSLDDGKALTLVTEHQTHHTTGELNTPARDANMDALKDFKEKGVLCAQGQRNFCAHDVDPLLKTGSH